LENDENFVNIKGRNYPVVYVETRKDFPEGWKFYCKYCKDWHLHGRGLGHRVAHCSNPDSPYKKTGYILDIKK